MSTLLREADRLRSQDPARAIALYAAHQESIDGEDEDRLGWISQNVAPNALPVLAPLLERVAASATGPARQFATHSIGAQAWYEGRCDEAEQCWRTVLRELQDDSPLWVRACLNLAAALSERSHYFESLVLTGMGARAAEKHGLAYFAAFAAIRRGATLATIGDHQRARTIAAESEERLAAMTDAQQRAVLETEALSVWSQIFIETKQWERALSAVNRRIAILPQCSPAPSIIGEAHICRIRVRFELEHERRAELLELLDAIPQYFALADDWKIGWQLQRLELRVRYALEDCKDREVALDYAQQHLALIRQSSNSDATRAMGAAALARQLADDIVAPDEARAAFDLAATASLRRIVQAHRAIDELPELAQATPDDWIALGQYRQRLADRQREIAARVAVHFTPNDPAFDLIVSDDLVKVCAWCNRVAMRDHTWLPLEHFSPADSGFSVTHGICIPCRDQHFPIPQP